MPKLKLCEKCSIKWKRAAAEGGRNGSPRDKRRASRLAVIARAEKALKLTQDGMTLGVADWSNITGIPKSTIWRRFRQGLSTQQILKPSSKKTTP